VDSSSGDARSRTIAPVTKSRKPTLSGRVVLVAGADSPAGAALARAVAGEGAAVVACGKDAPALGLLVAELHEVGARVALFIGDPTGADDRLALAEMVGELFYLPGA